MNDTDENESFAKMFLAAGFAARSERTQQRLRAERRSTMSTKQRHRGATRTAQINFRCTPDFKVLAAGLAKHCDASVADVMEEALALLAREKGYRGGE